ncbi:hypothetical protein [Actinoplanes sp. M2I2]|uniref:hypothetical protein n=1 Tax=Actinoplanes sp. M2I2 TaxID=1734444 RepID=UPI00201FEAD8|nr:hypothetical protein [Actinoplanes sp. M2I2]
MAALLAVIAAIGVPQLVARPSVPPVTPPKAGLLDLRFSGYRSGDLRVGDPEWVSIENQLASIGRELSPGVYRSVGRLALYPTGSVPHTFRMDGPRESGGAINGREAWFIEVLPHAVSTADSLLTWQNSDSSTGVLASYENRLSRTEMMRLASAFRVSPPRPARLPFAITWVPPTMRLAAIDVSRPRATTAVLLPGPDRIGFELDPAYEQPQFVSSWSRPVSDSMRLPGDLSFPRTTPGNAPVPGGGIVIGVQRSFMPGTGPTPKCATWAGQRNVRQCQAAPDATSNLVARAGHDVPEADLQRVAAAGRIVGAVDNPGTWPTTQESFPTSAQVSRD